MGTTVGDLMSLYMKFEHKKFLMDSCQKPISLNVHPHTWISLCVILLSIGKHLIIYKVKTLSLPKISGTNFQVNIFRDCRVRSKTSFLERKGRSQHTKVL